MPVHLHVKFFHSSALDSEPIWTSLGTFSLAHEQLLSEACYNCTKENMLREILCMVPQSNHSSQAQEKRGMSFALEYKPSQLLTGSA